MFSKTLSPFPRCLLFLSSCSQVFPREITFPPVAGINPHQASLGIGDDVDIVTGSAWSGLTTFANLPYVSCFADRPDVEKYDIAFLGAPFDTVSSADFIIFCIAHYSLYCHSMGEEDVLVEAFCLEELCYCIQASGSLWSSFIWS